MEKLNILETPLEIKLDAREADIENRHNTINLRTWTNVNCRIEFLKTSFPPFMKIIFYTPKSDPNFKEILTLRINLHGLVVQLATSRTKQYSYGLFWKTKNKKRCSMFLAFSTLNDFQQHFQFTTKNLKHYRKEFLLNRLEKPNDSMISSINNTQNVKDIKEILGPLPNIPVSESWIGGQQSRISGIYEEIGESRTKERNLSCDSILSGVYEDIHWDSQYSPQKSIERRKRVNTNEFNNISRSNTNGEADLKKKWWKFFDSSSKRHAKPSLANYDLKERKVVTVRRQFKSTFHKSNRNSFSTPDLSQLPEVFINNHRGDSNDFLNISFESISNGYSLNAFNDLSITNKHEQETNILNTNSSSVNFLPYSDFNNTSQDQKIENEPIYQVPKNIPIRLIDENTGYCIMGPPMKLETNVSDEKNNSSSHYLKMDEVRVELRKKPQDEPIYANIERRNTSRYSVEDKIPSYFPNETSYQKPRKHCHELSKNQKPWNIYSPTPKKHNKSSKNTLKNHDLNKSYEKAMLNQIELDKNDADTQSLSQHSSQQFLEKRQILEPKHHFGSLPRLKKIDFSPLRVKLNNLFLRYNNQV